MMKLSKRIQAKTAHGEKSKRHLDSSEQGTRTETNTSYYTPPTVEDLAVLTLDENGMIKECSKAGADLLGCAASKLTWLNVSKFLPRLGEVALLQGERVNPYLRFLSRAGHQFEFIAMSGAHFTSQLFFNEAENQNSHYLRVIIQPVGLQAA
jgi:PAS domain-containing protein